jgi:hypothetical protein
MRKDSTEWDRVYKNTSHFCRGDIQYSVTNRGKFTELLVYANGGLEHLKDKNKVFFEQRYQGLEIFHTPTFYNCPDAFNDAKRYALADPVLQHYYEVNRLNLKQGLDKMINVGDSVYRKNDISQVGEVVEVDEVKGRYRVLWPGYPDQDQFYMSNRPKRTWLKGSALEKQIIVKVQESSPSVLQSAPE